MDYLKVSEKKRSFDYCLRINMNPPIMIPMPSIMSPMVARFKDPATVVPMVVAEVWSSGVPAIHNEAFCGTPAASVVLYHPCASGAETRTELSTLGAT